MLLFRTIAFRLSLVFVITAPAAFAGNDSTAIVQLYVKKQSTLSLQVLRLYEDNTYDYCQYTRKKTHRDTGHYVMHKKKLQLESTTQKNSFNPYLHKTLYVSEAGLHRTRIKALMKKESLIKPNEEYSAYGNWEYNPVTKINSAASANATVNTPKNTTSANTTPKKNIKENSYKPVLPEVKVKAAEPGIFAKNYYIAVCSTYNTGYDKVLEKAYCGPDCYYSVVDGKLISWNKDTAISGLFSSIETVIHESVHQYNGRTYLVTPDIAIAVPRSKTYTSSEVKAIAPKDARSKIFRYETYIGDSSRVSANVSGIFGLLDEFSAYSHGVRFCVKAAQGAMAKGDTSLARSFLGQASSTSYAYYEFNLFMGWYLHYGKTNHPDVYAETMKNNNLRLAYTLLEQEYTQTNKELLVLSKLAGNSMSFSRFEDPKESYIAPLLKAEQPYLDAFKIKGANSSNYATFLKVE